MKISLRPITLQNFDEVINLALFDHQNNYLASNCYSIAEASLNPSLRTHAVYGDEQAIGFVMYRRPEHSDAKPGIFEIWRFMIAAKVQGLGYGRQTLELLLREICADEATREIRICYAPENESAKRFYASLGFQELAIDPESGDMDAAVAPAAIRWSATAAA